MRKIILFIFITFLLTSCFWWEKENEKVVENNKDIKNIIVKSESKINKLEDLVNNQKFDEAIPELEKMYNANPNEISNILNYMSALLAKWSITRQEKEYSEKAIKIWNKALINFSNNSELYRNIWYAYEIAENYDESFKAYDKSIELDPNNAIAYSNRGHAYRLYWDYSKSEIDFLKAYELDKTNDFVLTNLGWLNMIQFYNLNDALKYYNEAIKVTKNIRLKSEDYHSIWYIYIWKWKYDEAEKSFLNAIKSDEKFELWYLGLSEVQMLKLIYRSKDKTTKEKDELFNEALKNNEIAIALNPTKAMSYFKKWLILKDLKEYKDESKLMFQLALDAVDVDLTLWEKEKENLKKYIITNLKENEQK